MVRDREPPKESAASGRHADDPLLEELRDLRRQLRDLRAELASRDDELRQSCDEAAAQLARYDELLEPFRRATSRWMAAG